MLQASILRCLHILGATSEIYDKTIINSPVHLGTFYVRHEHAWNWLRLSMWWKCDFWVRFLTELDSSSCLPGFNSSDGEFGLAPQAELLVVLGIMGL